MRASAVVYVGNLKLMREFYGRCFGLSIASDAMTYCGLESDAWSLMLVQSAEAVPSTAPPPRREATPVKLAFEVPGIDAARNMVDQLGGRVDPEATMWRFENTLRCDCTDPEGNVVQLVQTAERGSGQSSSF